MTVTATITPLASCHAFTPPPHPASLPLKLSVFRALQGSTDAYFVTFFSFLFFSFLSSLVGYFICSLQTKIFFFFFSFFLKKSVILLFYHILYKIYITLQLHTEITWVGIFRILGILLYVAPDNCINVHTYYIRLRYSHSHMAHS